MLVQVQADKDYEVKGVDNGTFVFLENLVTQLAFRLHGAPVKITRSKHEITGRIKTANGLLLFVANTVESSHSKAVQIADVVLGLFKLTPKEITKIATFTHL